MPPAKENNDIEEEEEVRTLVIRARDGDWIMGEDLVLPVTGQETVVEILEIIKATKGVPVTRMAVFKGEEADERISDKHMTWSLSRNGLYTGDILLVRPTQPNQWLWHPLEWYEEILLKSTDNFIQRAEHSDQGYRGCPLSVLEGAIAVPPPLRRHSLRGILRRFPERLRLELDLVSQMFRVLRNVDMLLPSSF